MPFIDWSPELELGIGEIDRQHHWLVDATNQLHEEVVSDHPSQDLVAKLLAGLADYTVEHFITEELLFERFAYPRAEAHHKEHSRFIKAVRDWEQRHAGGEPLGPEILEFLKRWLTFHIMKSDRAFAPFLKERGIS